MKIATLAMVAAVAFPAVTLAEAGDASSSDSSTAGASRTIGAAADSSRLPPSPGVTQNEPSQQTNGAPGDPGNTGSDSGMKASDEKTGSVIAPPTSRGSAPSNNTKVDE